MKQMMNLEPALHVADILKAHHLLKDVIVHTPLQKTSVFLKNMSAAFI